MVLNLIEFNGRLHTEGMIPITSEDQFVPLYVAYLNVSGGSINTDNFYDKDSNKLPFKDVCKVILNYPTPLEYPSLPSSTYFYTEHGSFSLYPGDVNSFFGDSDFTLVKASKYVHVLPGVLATRHSRFRVSSLRKDEIYQSIVNITNFTKSFNEFTVTRLIVVKAKFIPYIRARVALRLPLELPFDSIKLLKNSDVVRDTLYYGTTDTIDNSISSESIPTYYVSYNVMNSFVRCKSNNDSVLTRLTKLYSDERKEE